MIDLSFTDEQRLLEHSVREWAARDVAPYIRENDRQHRFDRERVLGGMTKLGLLGVAVPAEYGGAGMDYISLGLVSEELEYVDTSLRVILSVHAGLHGLTLLTWGTEDQKRRYLMPQAQGLKIAGYALTEPSAGSDARGIQTTAVKKGSRYLITNIDRRTFDAVSMPGGDALEVQVGGHQVQKVVSTYADAGPGEICALFGSTDHLEIAASGASAARLLDLGRGAAVRVVRRA